MNKYGTIILDFIINVNDLLIQVRGVVGVSLTFVSIPLFGIVTHAGIIVADAGPVRI